jgi:hypothetical protein
MENAQWWSCRVPGRGMDRAEWNRQLKSNKKRMHMSGRKPKMSGRTELARGIDHHIRCEKQFQCIPEDTIVACHPTFDSLEEQSLYIASGLPSVPQREHNCPIWAGRSGNTVLTFRHATARAVTGSNGMSDQGSKIFTRQEANGNYA